MSTDPKRVAGWVLVSFGLLVGMAAGMQSVNEGAKAQLEGPVEDPGIRLWRRLGGVCGGLCACLLFFAPGVMLLRSGRERGNSYIR
jgi:hypothetical protein